MQTYKRFRTLPNFFCILSQKKCKKIRSILFFSAPFLLGCCDAGHCDFILLGVDCVSVVRIGVFFPRSLFGLVGLQLLHNGYNFFGIALVVVGPMQKIEPFCPFGGGRLCVGTSVDGFGPFLG